MIRRRQVPDKVDVIRPREFRWILGATDDETPFGQKAGGFNKQRIQDLLPIGGIRSEIGEIRPKHFLGWDRKMRFRIHTSVNRRDIARAETALQLFESTSAGVT